MHMNPRLNIGFGGLLALTKIGIGFGPILFGNPKRSPADRTPPSKTKHQARTLIGAPMMHGIDTEGATTSV
jgi:hypothetical protein